MSELTLSAFLADRLRASGAALCAAAAKMPAERLRWHPSTEGNAGRDALDQLAECAVLNEWAAGAFRAGAVTELTDYDGKSAAMKADNSTLDKVKRGTDNLAAAVAAMPAGKLGETVTNPFTKSPTTWAELAHFFYWNTVYHEGQVNYIQVLYGDKS